MAEFSTTSFSAYTRDGDSFSKADFFSSDDAQFLEQGSGIDGFLQPGEVLDFTEGGTQVTYVGSLEFNGNFFVLFESDTGQYNLESTTTEDQADYPPSFHLSDLDTTTPLPICFARGTAIATPDGERAVETLRVGDLVLTQDGRSVPVKWVGHQTLHKIFTPTEYFRPVRIAAGALGRNGPHSDLVVTKDHGFLLQGIIATAGALVNDMTITVVPMEELAERETYWHVETEAHEIILANGAPAETFIDNVSRRLFDNYAEFEALYGADLPEMTELPLPRASSRRQLPQTVRQELAGSVAKRVA